MNSQFVLLPLAISSSPLLLILILLLPLGFTQVDSLLFQLPFISTGSLRTRLIRLGLWRATLHKMRQDLFMGTQLEFFQSVQVGNISVGTPPQYFEVAFDTASPFSWLVGPDCANGPACKGDPVISGHSKRPFYKSLSSTAVATNRTFENPHYRSGSTGPITKGQIHLDRLQIGPLHFHSQSLGLAHCMADIWANHPVDGVLGLAWPLLAENKEMPPLLNMLDQLDEPVFTVWMDWRRPRSLGGPGGFITFGGKDNQNCEPPWLDIPLSSRSHWQFRVQKFQVGRFRSWQTHYAIADTGTALIGGPHSQINMIVEATNAVYSVEDDLFTVPCSQIPSLPPFVLTINGREFAIPPQEYILDVGIGGGKCVLAVFGMYSNGFNADWILGDIFFDTFCTMFDYGQGKLSVARAKDAVPYL